MDFSLSADQDSLRELTVGLLSTRCTNDHLKVVSKTETGYDLDLWKSMAETGLAGIALPESVGGGGLGFLEVCIVLEEVGRYAAPVPAFAVMALGGLALSEFGALDALDGVADGRRIVTAALHEPTGDVYDPYLHAADGKLTGTKLCVPAGMLADAFVVSTDDGLYLVDAEAPGLVRQAEGVTNGLQEAQVDFNATPGRKIADREGLEWLLERATAAQCVMMAAIADAALKLTAQYAKDRVQFERAIATFQAVSQRAADAYIDTEAIRLTAWQAAWRLSENLPASTHVASAKFWASEGGQRVVHAAAHIHGGVGVDRDYPLHRYFLAAKQLELSLGGATPSLVRLGQLLASQPA
jgi:acyl-CoA dehydrogenase